ncbi:hypothetical protein ACFE04_010322 [Oxalis oulophora]
MLSASHHAPTFPFFSLVFSSSKSTTVTTTTSMAKSSVRIAVVGDVHDDWNLLEDTKALQFLQPDLVLFTGDFGNENVELVESIARLDFPKAVILGNHDAWGTQQFSSKKKDNVQLQLECLGAEHVGYKRLDFPSIKLSVVGGRPFSCGGQQIYRKKLLVARYGIQDMDGSAKRIYNAASGTPKDHLVIILAHNGPTGLGSNLNDICGRDWFVGGGDHGDPDLAQAISKLKESTNFIPVVIFGHMHKHLAQGSGQRKMIVVGDDNTVYLNGAIVPRVKFITDQANETSSSTNQGLSLSTPEPTGTIRAFTVMEILNGRVDKIAENWVSVVGAKTSLEEEHILFKSER